MNRERQTSLWDIYHEYERDPAFNNIKAHDAPKRLVPGRGSMSPCVVFVGEAPGRNESEQRRPFVGAAGRVLDQILRRIDLPRSEIFITNLVKYRPTVGTHTVRNRTPNTAEITASRPYVIREIEVFDPGTPVIVLGGVALRGMWPDGRERISAMAGRGWYDADRAYGVLRHPAVACYDPGALAGMLDDATAVWDVLGH